jgi:hypothetical protein
MRQRRNGNGVPLSGPERDDERALDATYVSLFAVMRAWRRQPNLPEKIKALVAAYDAREDALIRVVEEDERRRELPATEARASVAPMKGTHRGV